MSEKRDQGVGVADALKILHESCRQNIEFAKNQQWRIANYALLIYAALVAVVRIGSDTDPLTVRSVILRVAAFIGVVVALFGLYMLIKLQKSQTRARQMLTRVRTHFPKEFHDARGPQPTHFESFRYHGEIFGFLMVVILVGLFVALWLLWYWV